MEKLLRSADRKVANAVTAKANVAIKNTFGLPAGDKFSCPEMTSICYKICYANRISNQYSNVDKLLNHNWNLLKDASLDQMIELLTVMIDEFRAECDKRNVEKLFRIHWSGDYFNQDYCDAWEFVMRHNSDIQFWSYSRSQFAAGLSEIPNHAFYLSADSENIDTVQKTMVSFPNAKVAMLADTFGEAKDMLASIGQSGPRCPEQTKAIPLISNKGGACTVCNLCVTGRASVQFAFGKKK